MVRKMTYSDPVRLRLYPWADEQGEDTSAQPDLEGSVSQLGL